MSGKKYRRNRAAKDRHPPQHGPTGTFLLFISTRLCAGLVFATLTILLYLDLEIRQRFSGAIQSQPAHVYTRPLQLNPGAVFSPIKLAETLQGNGYRRVRQISNPGDFAVSDSAVDLHLQGFDTGIDRQKPQAVRITFRGNTIASVADHATTRGIDYIIIEPLLIGSLQLGPYQDRIALKLHQMPELLIKALLVMEDRNFQSHFGVDPKAILRALWTNIRGGRAIQGGSTLTQQLVKNLFLNPKRTISRKAMEAIMAIMMEVRFSKAEILELYLNEIFLGQSGNRAVHGFALASEYYFGRPVDQLKLHETSLLISMIPAPSFYNPRRHPERALKRRNRVLHTLAKVGAISAHTADTLSASPLGIIPHQPESSSDFPAYLDYLHRQLRQYYSEEVLRTNGLQLYTSLDASVQQIAQRGLSETLGKLERQKGFNAGTLQGAVIVVEPEQGEILALVGDRIKGYSGFNRAIDAQRPIGSLVKPFIYLAALEQPKKYSLATLLEDSPLTLTPKGGELWSPQNYDKQFRGPLPLYQSLAHSYNVPTVRLGLDIGVATVIATMRRLGIERNIENYPSTLLGASRHTPLEIAQMYQTLANNGLRLPLRTIRSIQNNRGESIAKFPRKAHRAIDRNSAFLIDFALQQVVLQGTAIGLSRSFSSNLGLRGKTGTTDRFRDSWFAGYSGNLLTVVWVGRDDNRPTGLSGSGGAMRVWENVMSNIDLEIFHQRVNEDIVFARIDPESGLVANTRCARRQNLPFIRGTQPEVFAPCSGFSGKMKN